MHVCCAVISQGSGWLESGWWWRRRWQKRRTTTGRRRRRWWLRRGSSAAGPSQALSCYWNATSRPWSRWTWQVSRCPTSTGTWLDVEFDAPRATEPLCPATATRWQSCESPTSWRRASGWWLATRPARTAVSSPLELTKVQRHRL